ncbi:hypothetical protein GCM10009760_41140 [Kitasatospora kazusensis]|uniref:Transposase n=1 Tax=Kitasatospora kazusensis TaxID=407974 RepID=A0ABN2ZW28_9ACTN
MATMGRPMAQLVLSEDERATLVRWSRRAKSSQALAQRCRIVLGCATWWPCTWTHRNGPWCCAWTGSPGSRHSTGPHPYFRNWIKTWNENPRPFAWTKTADEILERLASYLDRIPGAGH